MSTEEANQRIRFEAYRPTPARAKPAPLKAPPAAAVREPAYPLGPELRAWLEIQEKVLAYWASCPDAQFIPPIPAVTRKRERAVLFGLRDLLA